MKLIRLMTLASATFIAGRRSGFKTPSSTKELRHDRTKKKR
jgi:hypothetical protein